MSDNNPKITFKGEDQLSPIVDSVKKNYKELTKEIFENSLAHSTTSKGALLAYQQEINLLKQKTELERNSKKEVLAQDYNKRIARINYDKQEAEKILKDPKADKEDRLQAASNLKKDVFGEARLENEADYKRQLKLLDEELKEDKKQTKYLEDNYKQLNILVKLLGKDNPDAEISYQKLLEEQGIEGPGEKLRDRVEKESGNKKEEEKGKGIFSGAFWGTLLAQGASSLMNKVGTATETIIGGKSGEEIIANLVKSSPIPGTTALGSILERSEQAGFAKGIAQSKYRALSKGKDLVGLSVNGEGKSLAGEYGYTADDMADIQSNLIKGRGTVAGMDKEIPSSLSLIKGLGLDISEIAKTSSTYKYQDKQRTASENISVMVKALENAKVLNIKDEGNVRIAELLSIQNKLVEDQGTRLEKVSPETISTVMAAFGTLGGSWKDARAGGRIASVDEGLRNPQGDYQKAMSYAVLAKLNPKADLWELEEMQAKGTSQPGYMKGMMEMVTGQYGNTSLAKFKLKNIFPGVPLEAIDELLAGSGNFGNIDNIGIEPSKNGWAGNYTSEIEKKRANLENAWAQDPATGLKVSFDQMKDEIGKVGITIVDLLDKLYNEIKN